LEIEKVKNVPEVVALIAMGTSRMNYIAQAMKAGGPLGIADETWVINKLASVYYHDLCFRMDDLRKPRNCNLRRGTNRDPNKMIEDTQLAWMKTHDKPIITSTAYPEFPTSVSYPLEGVINTIGYSYFITTPAYAAAFAIHIGVKHLKVYGCDYTYLHTQAMAEAGRGNLEFILGIGMMKGMKVTIAQSSTLLGTNLPMNEQLYGYKNITEVIESDEEGKTYAIKDRPDLTEELEGKWEAEERRYLKELKQKYESDGVPEVERVEDTPTEDKIDGSTTKV